MMSFSPNQLIGLQQSVQKSLESRERRPGAMAAWTSHCPREHAAEYDAFKASNPAKQGIALLFCAQWRKDHPEEYAAFEAAHKEKYSSAGAPAEAPSAVASVAAGADASPFLAPAFTKQYALVEERKGDFERAVMIKMAEGWELQGGVSLLPSGRYLQAIHRDTRKRNNSGAGSSGGRRKLTRKSRR